jgi:hypothetical protein
MSSILQHAPTLLSIFGDFIMLQKDLKLDVSKIAATVGAGRQLRHVVMNLNYGGCENLGKVLTHPTLAAGVESLTILESLIEIHSFTVCALDLALKHLHTSLHSLSIKDRPPSDESLKLIACFPNLTELNMEDMWSELGGKSRGESSVIMRLSLAGMTRPLARLHLLNPNLDGANFRANLLLPLCVALTCLHLEYWTATYTSSSDFEATFRALHSLHKLVLTQVKGVNMLLAHVHHASKLRTINIFSRRAPKLRALHIFTQDEFDHDPSMSTLAQPVPLSRALQANKLLHITMTSPQVHGLSSSDMRIYGKKMIHLTNLGPRLSLITN